MKYLDQISDEAIVELNIPTGIPLVYELDAKLAPIRHYYLGDPDAAQRAAEAVANQSKQKTRESFPRQSEQEMTPEVLLDFFFLHFVG